MKLPLPERYIVSKCHELANKVTLSLKSYAFGEAGREISEFLWDEFADWYIEASKSRIRAAQETSADESNIHDGKIARKVLVYVWDTCLRLLHPFMPFLTEALWQLIPHQGDSVMVQPWPLMDEEELFVDSDALKSFSSLQALVRAIRNIRAEYNVDVGKKLAVVLRISCASFQSTLDREKAIFCMLARVDQSQLSLVAWDDAAELKDQNFVHLIVEEGLEAFIPQDGLVDKTKELARLGKQQERLLKDVAVLEGRLKSKGFVEKAPEALVAEVRSNLSDLKEQLSAVERSLGALSV